jgi:DNA-binding transcriptional ArsR family regulator
MTASALFFIDGLRQVRALASPLRAAIVDALEVLGPAAVGDLAAALGYPPDGLYYHLRVLRRVGLIREAGGGEGKGGVRYDLPGRPATLRYRLDDRSLAEATAAVVATMTRCAQRSFRRGYAPGRATAEGPQRNLRAGRRTAWLTAADLEKLNALIERVHRLFARGRAGRPGARLHEFTYVLAPAPPLRRRPHR